MQIGRWKVDDESGEKIVTAIEKVLAYEGVPQSWPRIQAMLCIERLFDDDVRSDLMWMMDTMEDTDLR